MNLLLYDKIILDYNGVAELEASPLPSICISHAEWDALLCQETVMETSVVLLDI